MDTTSLGSQAEQLVSDHLTSNGYKILVRNWRRPSCEIDIVAKKAEIIYFVEVKFRKQPEQGTGMEHITPTKLKQMTYAADVWTVENDWAGNQRLMAAAVDYIDGQLNLAEVEEIN